MRLGTISVRVVGDGVTSFVTTGANHEAALVLWKAGGTFCIGEYDATGARVSEHFFLAGTVEDITFEEGKL